MRYNKAGAEQANQAKSEYYSEGGSIRHCADPEISETKAEPKSRTGSQLAAPNSGSEATEEQAEAEVAGPECYCDATAVASGSEGEAEGCSGYSHSVSVAEPQPGSEAEAERSSGPEGYSDTVAVAEPQPGSEAEAEGHSESHNPLERRSKSEADGSDAEADSSESDTDAEPNRWSKHLHLTYPSRSHCHYHCNDEYQRQGRRINLVWNILANGSRRSKNGENVYEENGGKKVASQHGSM